MHSTLYISCADFMNTDIYHKMSFWLCLYANACLLVSFLIAEGRRSFRAPAVSIVACPSPTLNTLPLICSTSPWYHLSIFASASSSLSINSTFQYFGAQVSVSDNMAKILKLTSLYSCQQSFLWLYFMQHRCISPMCHPAYPQQSSICCHLKTSYLSYVHRI